MSHTILSRNTLLGMTAADTQSAPSKILLAGDRLSLDVLKGFTGEVGGCFTATDVTHVISILSDQKGISLVAAEMPHSPDRCAICLLMRAYFPTIPFLLISEEKTIDRLSCTHCPRNCGVRFHDQYRFLKVTPPHSTHRVAPQHSCLKVTGTVSMKAPEELCRGC